MLNNLLHRKAISFGAAKSQISNGFPAAGSDLKPDQADGLAQGAPAPTGGEFRVNTFSAGIQSESAVVALADGGFVVTWTSIGQDGSGTGIYGQRYTAGGLADGGEFRINTYTASAQVYSSVAALANGGFVVTWSSNGQDSSLYGIYGQRYTAAGLADGGEFRINSYTTSNQVNSSVAPLTDGGFVVTWSSFNQDGNDWGIYGQRYTAAGLTDGGEFRINSYTPSAQIYSSVTGLANGGFVVTWQSGGQDGSGTGIYGQRYTAAGLVDGGEFQINTFTSLSQQHTSVAPLDGGGFVVTWISFNQDGDGFGIYGQRYTATGLADGGEFQINTYITDDQVYSSVAALGDGGFVVTWQSDGQDGSGTGIYGQRFSAAGLPDGDEFQISETTTDNQSASSSPMQGVAQLADGSLIAVWFGNGTGDTSGVFARTFALPNAAPEGADATLTIGEDTPRALSVIDFGFADTDGDALFAVWITSLPAAGMLTLNGAAVVVGQSVTAAQLAANQLVFTPAADADGLGAAAFTFQVQDDGSTAYGGQDIDQSANTLTFDVTAINDAPMADLNGAGPGLDVTGNYIEGGSAIRPLSDVTISDVDSATLISATVTISSGLAAGDLLRGSLGLSGTTGSGITYSYNSGTGLLTMSGSASAAAYQAELAALSFKSTSDNPGTARDITVVVTDGAASSVAAHILLTVASVNDAPVNTVPGAQMSFAGSPLVFSTTTGNALSVADPDGASSVLRIKLTATTGTVTLADTAGLLTIAGNGTRQVIMTGTAAEISDALDGLTYQSVPGFTGLASLKIATFDLGNTGSGTGLTDTDRVAITVQPMPPAQEPALEGAFDLAGLFPKAAGAAALFDFAPLAKPAPDPGTVWVTSFDLVGQIEGAVWHDPALGGSDFLL